MSNKVSKIITEQILKKLEEGVVPWRRPYQGVFRFPRNFETDKLYTGTNMLLLMMYGYKSPYWLTEKQVKKHNGWIKGEEFKNYVKILWASHVEKEDDDGNKLSYNTWRYYRVWNLDQIDGIECPYVNEDINELDFKPIEKCEMIIDDLQKTNKIPMIRFHERNIACYVPAIDLIKTCRPELYKSEEEYYSTLFHEIIHSTGHESRLKRKLRGGMKSKSYAKEELVAEIGSCFICAVAGIAPMTLDNSVAYIDGWRKALSKEPSLIVNASSLAQKACDYLDVFKFSKSEIQEKVA